jgi:hypothetical protein
MFARRGNMRIKKKIMGVKELQKKYGRITFGRLLNT